MAIPCHLFSLKNPGSTESVSESRDCLAFELVLERSRRIANRQLGRHGRFKLPGQPVQFVPCELELVALTGVNRELQTRVQVELEKLVASRDVNRQLRPQLRQGV